MKESRQGSFGPKLEEQNLKNRIIDHWRVNPIPFQLITWRTNLSLLTNILKQPLTDFSTWCV